MSSILSRSVAVKAVRLRTAIASSRLATPANQIRALSLSSLRSAKRFTKSHEWVDVADDGKSCTVGISRYAADALGDVVYIELPATGDDATYEEPFGTVESVKSASDVLSPVSGTITSVNEALADTPGDLSKDPEGKNWLVKLEASDAAAVDSLMDEAAYAEYIKSL